MALHIHNSMDSETWTTRNKRSKRAASPSDDEYLALCLVMLARGITDRRPDDNASSTPATYICTVCAKSFSSYQALGGHKASHRTKPPLSAKIAPSHNLAAAPVVSASAAPSPTLRVHECSICHKCFPTGQALGGHKRRHYEGGTTTTSSTNNNNGTNSDAPTSSDIGTFSRNFDLNLPAAPELSVDLQGKK